MANNLPIIGKAFLTTRNTPSGMFLLTERFENDSKDSLLFYIIESGDSKNAESLQKSIQANLVKPYMSNTLFSISQFEESLHYINQKLCQTSFSNINIQINALIGLSEKNDLHISMIGNIEGYLLRKGKINSVTEGLTSNDSNSFANITSGVLALGDLVIIANKSLFNRLSLDRIRRTLNQYSPREAIKDFYQILRKSKNIDCNALLFQAVTPLSLDKENRNLPDLLYLDEIIESKFSKFIKKSKPQILDIFGKIEKTISGLRAFLVSIFAKTRSYWEKNITPRSKQIVSSRFSKSSDSFSKISPKIISPEKSKKTNLKIKPYIKKKSFDMSLYIKYVSAFALWLFAKKNRRFVYVGLIAILIFVAYLKISSNNQNRELIKKQNDSIFAYQQAEEAFKIAKDDIALGKTDGVDKLKSAMTQAEEAAKSDATKTKALGLIKNIQIKIDELSQTKRFYDQKPIFSFKSDPVVATISGSKIYAFTAEGKIYMSDSRDKDPKLVGAIDTELGKPVSAAYSDSMSLIFVITDKAEIWAFDEQSQSGAEVMLDTGGSWENAKAITSYSTNLYLLDSNIGKIWRHGKSGDKFISGKAYAGSKNTDAKDGISIAIDGAIYVLKANGTVIKFSHTIPDTSFVLQAIASPSKLLESANQIYTDADSQHIFILDQTNNRVIKYAKDGLYAGQYVVDGAQVNQILVNSRLQKIWMIAGRDVYELDL